MQGRYIAAIAIAAFAGASLHPALDLSWHAVALISVGAAMLLGAHGVDRYKEALRGVEAGSIAVKSEGDEQ
jgi:hypothetical protein